MRFVASEKPITTKHAKLGELSVNVEVPQCDSMAEVVTYCGGEDAALAFFNSQIETNAKNGGRVVLRDLPDNANIDEAKVKVQNVVKEYAPRAGGDRTPGKAKKAAAFDEVAALVNSGQEFTREQLLELLAKAK